MSRGSVDERVRDFLRAALQAGPRRAAELEQMARNSGLLRGKQSITVAKAFKRAKKSLGVQSVKTGFGGNTQWMWLLDDDKQKAAIEVDAGGATRVAVIVDIEEAGLASGEFGLLKTWRQGVAGLHTREPHRDVPRHRWQQFVADCHQFMNSGEGWAERAAQLNWGSLDLFGCHRDRPLMYLGCSGLLWRINGGCLVDLYRDWAAYGTSGGAARVFHRRRLDPNQIVVPWAAAGAMVTSSA